ncbi:MAG: GNAT family N-acetyltransferase [Candidatus Sumerlaeota bacterium]|nr:GNAT family N-acetyltransferase [Candidatus Sumerlaeota bacterium]
MASRKGGPLVLEALLERFFRRGAILWVARIEGEIAGYCWSLVGGNDGHYVFPLGEADVVIMADEVFPDFRGRGIAPALIEEVLAWHGNQGASRAYIASALWNRASLRSIAKTRFQELATVHETRIFGHRAAIWTDRRAGQRPKAWRLTQGARRLTKLGLASIAACCIAIRDWIRPLGGRTAMRRPVVLCYHDVPGHLKPRFSAQLNTLLRMGRVVDLEDDTPSAARRFSLTFDDASRSVFENAVPELLQRGVRGTVFVASGHLGKNMSWEHDLEFDHERARVIDEQGLLGGAVAGIEVGAHGVLHKNLTRLSHEQAREEIVHSKDQLERLLGQRIRYFALPYGAYNADVVRMVKQAGYARAFGVLPDPAQRISDSFLRMRTPVSPEDWALEFRLKLMGAYAWARGPKALLCQFRALFGPSDDHSSSAENAQS